MQLRDLDHASGMQSSLCRQVGFVGKLWGAVSPESVPHAVYRNHRRPTFFVGAGTKYSTFALRSRSVDVLGIHKIADVTKVVDDVVARVAVSMVNLVGWPVSCGVEPRKSMGEVQAVIDPNKNVPVFSYATRDASGFHASTSNLSGKGASFRVVVKQFAQALRGKIGLSHDAVLSLIGQRPACVDSTGGLRYFITRACSGATGITKRLHKFVRPARLLFAHACKLPQNSQPSWGIDPANSF